MTWTATAYIMPGKTYDGTGAAAHRRTRTFTDMPTMLRWMLAVVETGPAWFASYEENKT